MSQIQKINSKSDLELLIKDKNALARLHPDKVEEFKTNFIEIYSEKYLLSKAAPSELLSFCIQVSNIGLSINPWHKELYILPFKQKDGSFKLEAVFSKDGIQEMAFNNGFQIECTSVWNFGGNGVLLKDLTYQEQSKINFTNAEFVEKHFLGFEFELFDLKGNLRPQKVFVTFDYLKEVTKQLQSKTHQIANYSHKAFRKAYNEFFIPKGRDTRDKLNKLDNINYNDEPIETVQTNDTDKKELSTLYIDGVSKSEDVVNYNQDDMTRLFNKDKSKQSEMMKFLVQGWRDYPQDKMNELYKKLSEL